MREAIEFHLEGMRLHDDPIPEPSTRSIYVDVAA
jgi:predicted RNase H-like HicB family nuclease